MNKFKHIIAITIYFQIITQLIKIIKLYLNGVFLNPKELGIFAIVGVFIFFLESFSKTGTSDYLIAKNDVVSNEEWYNAWTIDFIKNMVLFAITIAAAPIVTSFFKEDVTNYLYIFSIVFIFNALRNNRILQLQKSLNFKKYLTYNLIPIILGVICNYVLFSLGYTIISLVISTVIQSFFLLILSFLFYPCSVHLYLDKSITKKQLNFGKWIFGQTISDFMFEKFDRFFLAKIAGVTWLGNYQFAATFTSDLQFQFRGFCRTALFPYFSNNNEPDSIRVIFDKFLTRYNIISFVGFLLALFVYDDVIQMLFGHKWDYTIRILAYLSLFTISNNLIISTESIFLSRFEPKKYFYINLLKVTFYLISLLALGFLYHTQGVLYALFLSSIFNLILFFGMLFHYRFSNKRGIIVSFVTVLLSILFFLFSGNI